METRMERKGQTADCAMGLSEHGKGEEENNRAETNDRADRVDKNGPIEMDVEPTPFPGPRDMIADADTGGVTIDGGSENMAAQQMDLKMATEGPQSSGGDFHESCSVDSTWKAAHGSTQGQRKQRGRRVRA